LPASPPFQPPPPLPTASGPYSVGPSGLGARRGTARSSSSSGSSGGHGNRNARKATTKVEAGAGATPEKAEAGAEAAAAAAAEAAAAANSSPPLPPAARALGVWEQQQQPQPLAPAGPIRATRGSFLGNSAPPPSPGQPPGQQQLSPLPPPLPRWSSPPSVRDCAAAEWHAWEATRAAAYALSPHPPAADSAHRHHHHRGSPQRLPGGSSLPVPSDDWRGLETLVDQTR
jgi:hypothetical protein